MEKIKDIQSRIESRGKPGHKGRGSHLSFLSNTTQNKNNLIQTISQLVTDDIVKAIADSAAWALIADTTSDVAHHEQISIFVRIVCTNRNISEHLLACQRAMSTTAEDLFGVIFSTLQSKNVSFEKLIAQSYDGASNMSGCYGGLQALIKDQIDPNILYIHCYAHTLNLVLADSAAIAVEVVTLFGNLETLYVLFSRSHKVHNVFESIQLSHGLPIRSLKRLNTVRWNAREMCLRTFMDRYESILEALDIVHTDTSFDTKHRSEAAGLLISIQTKQFLATPLLFSEIFAITGPLSCYLQSIDNYLSRAMNMIDVSIASLEKIRNGSFDVIKNMDDTFKHIQSIQQHTTRACRPKGAPGTRNP